MDCHLSQGTVSSKEMSGNEDTHLLYRQCHILLFIFILFYFILFSFILFYFILFYFIILYFIFIFILFYFILFYFILFHLPRHDDGRLGW